VLGHAKIDASSLDGYLENDSATTVVYSFREVANAMLYRAMTFMAVSLACAASAIANPSAMDSFNYSPVGSAVAGNSGGGSSGFSDGWAGDSSFTLASGSLLSPVPLPPAIGNSVTANAFGGNREVARTLLQPLGTDNTTDYFSFLMQAQGTVGEGAFEGWFAFTLRADARNITIGKDSFHSLYKVESNLGDIAFSTVPVVANQPHLIVLRADFLPGADVFRLYMDPQTGKPEPSTASATLNGFDLGALTTIGLDGPGAFGFDELRIGTTWNSVTPAPEPTAFMLALIGVGILVAKKWVDLNPSSISHRFV
jgi:hypothetical protein